MANYTAEDVKKLREATAAGMLDCKKALDEADGDFQKAVDIIRVKGLKGVTKREGRTTSNGVVLAKTENNLGVMIELNCETDFVAKGERFVELANELVDHLAVAKSASLEEFLASTLPSGQSVQARIDEGNATLGAPQYVDRDSVPAEAIEAERRIAEDTARNEGKPEASISKIVEGRVTGFVKEVSLLEQAFAKDAKKTVKQILDEAKTTVSKFHRFRVGQ